MTSEAEARNWFAGQRVARLATADALAVPHVIPVCFDLNASANAIHITIDQKPKDFSRPIKRLRNIMENKQVAVIADRYGEDWSQLAWVMARGPAEILGRGAEHDAAQARLREKYPQYAGMELAALPVIAIRPSRWTWWGDIS